jgi:hypothetical protein
MVSKPNKKFERQLQAAFIENFVEKSIGGLLALRVGQGDVEKFKDGFVAQYKLEDNEAAQNYLLDLIAFAESGARREGYREAVLDLLDGLIIVSRDTNLSPEFLKKMRQTLGSPEAFTEFQKATRQRNALKK